MSDKPNIRFIERHEIDITKWDQCIRLAPNGLLYARVLYLDAMAKNWSALILGDYDAVMPLTWNKKYGIKYLYQPPFVAQLGLFFKILPANPFFDQFIEDCKEKFRFCEMLLNFANPKVKFPVHANYILRLGESYDLIKSKYKKRLIENLSEAEPHKLLYEELDAYIPVVRLYKNEYGKKLRHVKPQDYKNFEKLCEQLLLNKMLFVRQVSDQNGIILSACIFFKDEKRIYNIMSVTVSAGRKKRAHFFLLDNLIRQFAGENLTLDFEGSEIPGIAEFYKKFGSEYQPFPILYFNRLPFPIKYFK